MKQNLGVFSSDQTDLSGGRIPASSLMDAHEERIIDRHTAKLPIEMPVYIQHDMHRPIGLSKVLGHFLDGAMVRVVGLIQQCETTEEEVKVANFCAQLRNIEHSKGMQSFKTQLIERSGLFEFSNLNFVKVEAYAISHPNIAAQLYPELFDQSKSEGLVDKDGLMDYRALKSRMKQLQPGVFHDTDRDLVIFAHRFFRRSLSHQNKLNDYFLSSFDDAVNALGSTVTPRLRLDPDLIGHPDTNQALVELEFWHGPKFNDDIECIPSGIAEYKADDRTRYYHEVDKTHIWWKDPETRSENAVSNSRFRTFEIEELIDNASAGLNDSYGCRYAHAEYSMNSSSISHFDGAIRAYTTEMYLDRIDKQINQAGKHSHYSKLFRFDGNMPIAQWKKLLTDYFRGNPLIPEYLGNSEEESSLLDVQNSEPQLNCSPELCAFICFEPEIIREEFSIRLGSISLQGELIRTIETGFGALDKFLRSEINLDGVVSIEPEQKKIRLPKMSFGNSLDFPEKMKATISKMLIALREDVQNELFTDIAIPLSWQIGEYVITLSLRGPAKLVEQAMIRLFSIVDPEKLPSEWIEEVSKLIKDLAPLSNASNDLTGARDGILSFPEPNKVMFRIPLPNS